MNKPEFLLREITSADNAGIALVIKTVMTEFGATGQGFAIHDPEVQSMFEAYSDTRSRYWVLVDGDNVIGGGGIASLTGADEKTAELRKMYFLKEARGSGWGARLMERALTQAKVLGYEQVYLETLKGMDAAKKLYEAVGFKPIEKPMGATGHFGCDSWYLRKT